MNNFYVLQYAELAKRGSPQQTKGMKLSKLMKRASTTEDYAIDHSILSFTEEMLALMETRGMSRVQLAEKLKVRPSRITAILNGSQNFTFATAVRIARALSAEFNTSLKSK